MHAQPSAELLQLLRRLGLADPAMLAQAAAQVRRLARRLPPFDSVWVDALARQGWLSPYQAAEINAGRGERLRLGPYVLKRPLATSGLGRHYLAQHVDTRAAVRLLVLSASTEPASAWQESLTRLIERSRLVDSPHLARVEEVGHDGEHCWAACRYAAGRPLAEVVAELGRLPPGVVLHVARQLAAALAELERFDLVHGDLHARTIVLTAEGNVVVGHPGVRAIVRPAEGFAHADLRPEAYDYLAPERVERGSGPALASDLFALGGIAWHALTGRTPLAGGNSLAKLRAAHECRIRDLCELAVDVPEPLAAAVGRCLARDPAARPASAQELVDLLGPEDSRDAKRVVAWIQSTQVAIHRPVVRRRRRQAARRLVAGAALLLAIALSPWLVGRLLSASSPLERAAAKLTRPDTKSTVVAGASATRSAAAAPAVRRASAVAVVRPLLLPTGRVVRLAELRLRPGQLVRGTDSRRPQVEVTGAGVLVDVEGVTFENIDFVWLPDEAASATRPAVIRLAARRAEFRGCSFQSLASDAARPAAIAWVGPAAPLGRGACGTADLLLADCAVRNVTAAIDAAVRGTVTIELANTLHVAADALVRLERWPEEGEPLTLLLSRCTLRDGGSAVLAQVGASPAAAGAVEVTADECVLVPGTGRALVEWSAEDSPLELARLVRWSGQATLVDSATRVAQWRDGRGRLRELNEAGLDLAGLVRSELEFAAPADGPPAASRLVRWQGPSRSTEPPGINVGTVFLPSAPRP